MADNVTIPATGSGSATPVIATDDVGGVHYQLMKVNLAALDSAGSPWSSANPGPIIGYMASLSTQVTRPADTATYAVNDAFANSTTVPTANGFTFTGAARTSGGSGIITDLVVAYDDPTATPLQGELFIFNTSVTAINDNAAFAINDAEARTIVAKIPFALEVIGNNTFCHVPNLTIGYTCSGSADLRFLIRVKNAYVPASGGVLTFLLKVLQLT